MRYQPVEYMPETLEPGVLYVSEQFGCTMHICPCGCGRDVQVPIKPFWNDGWDLQVDGNNVTLQPSIANRVCKAHYWIRDSKVVYA